MTAAPEDAFLKTFIGSAALAAALLYASRRKERTDKVKPAPDVTPETD